jgi:hypothetical protein
MLNLAMRYVRANCPGVSAPPRPGRRGPRQDPNGGGYYRDSLTPELRSRLTITSAAVVMIDCDFYESTRQALDFVTPCVVDGGVSVFDDWINFRGDPRRGEQAAFREWLAGHPGIAANRYRDFGWRGVSFILSR